MAGRKIKETTPPTLPELRPRSAPIIERAPLPIVEVQGKNHLVSYVNSAFCSLLEKPRKDLIGKTFREIVPKGEDCLPVLDRVYQTGEAVTIAHEDDHEPAQWLFAMWPALDEEERPVGVIVQLTKAAKFRQDVTEVNEALLIAGLRQHEMTAEAEHLNAQLRAEIVERKQAEDKLRESEKETKRARDYAEATLRTAPVPLLILNADLRVNTTNEAFSTTFQVEPGEAEGKRIYDLGNRQWNIPELRELLEDILPKNKIITDYEVTHTFETIGRRTMLLNARRMENESGEPLRIVLAIEDITKRKQVEELLRQNEALFSTIVDQAPVGMYVVDAQFRFQQVNSRALPIFSGVSPLMGRDFSEVVHILWGPELGGQIAGIFRHTLETGERYISPGFSERRADLDVEQAYDWETQRVTLPNGKHGVVCYFTDITERERASEELRTSEERYRTLFTSIDEGFCVIETIFDEHDKPIDYRFLEVNPTFEKQTGLREAEGKRMRELVPEIEDHWIEIYGKVALTGEPIRFVKEAKAMDGRWFDAYACRVGEPEDRKVAVIFNDITARRKAEGALRESEERYRNLFNSIDEGFCIIEMIFDKKNRAIDYRFLEVNPSFEKQCGLHDPVGKRMLELAPEHEAYWFEIYGKVALTGEPIRFTNEAKALQRCFDVYVFRIGETESRKVAVIFNDITHRIRNEETIKLARDQIDHHAANLEMEVAERTGDLKDTNEQLAAFVYSIAHDLRAPLRSMQGFSHLLVEDYTKSIDQTGQDYLKRINASAEFMDKMILDLLAFGQAGHTDTKLEPVKVQSAWKSALYQYAAPIEQTKTQVETVTPLPTVLANEAALAQALANLLSNALKFVPEGTAPRIRFWAEDRGAMVRLWITDNGVGIQAEHQDRVFRVFERLHGARYPGTGIGLSIVRKGVDRMRGHVGVESEPGKGSRFWIDLQKA